MSEMTNSEEMSPQKAGAIKGAALRAAKKQAADTDQVVDLPQYGARIYPDGTREEIPVEGTFEHEPNTNRTYEHEPEPHHDEVLGKAHPPDAIDETGDYIDPVAARAAPTTLLGWANHYAAMGLDDEEAFVLANKKMGIPAAPEPKIVLGGDAVPMPTPGAPGGARTASSPEELGPDPEMVKEYERRMADYVEPVLHGIVTIEIEGRGRWQAECPVRFLDYLLRKAQWESAKRRREMNPADCCQWLIRQAKQLDQEAALLMNPSAATGPQASFNASAGGWN